jgi:hypothetical protein
MVQTKFGGTDEFGQMLHDVSGNAVSSRFAELALEG